MLPSRSGHSAQRNPVIQRGEATLVRHRQGEQIRIGNLVVTQHAAPIDQALVVFAPAQEHVRIELQLQRPSQAFSSASGKGSMNASSLMSFTRTGVHPGNFELALDFPAIYNRVNQIDRTRRCTP